MNFFTEITNVATSVFVAVFCFIITKKLSKSDKKRDKFKAELAERVMIAMSEAVTLTLRALKGQKLNGNVNAATKEVETAAKEYREHLRKTASEHYNNEW